MSKEKKLYAVLILMVAMAIAMSAVTFVVAGGA